MVEKELFDILYETSKFTYSGYLYKVWTTTALIVGSIGWLLTSNDTRDFLGKNKIARYISVGCILTLSFVHSKVLYMAQNKSEMIYKLLECVLYVKNNHIASHYYS